MQLSPCSVCCRFLLIVTDATLVLAAEWWSNVVVAEVQASVMFHAAWDVAPCSSFMKCLSGGFAGLGLK
jgi:hypothetical protein